MKALLIGCRSGFCVSPPFFGINEETITVGDTTFSLNDNVTVFFHVGKPNSYGGAFQIKDGSDGSMKGPKTIEADTVLTPLAQIRGINHGREVVGMVFPGNINLFFVVDKGKVGETDIRHIYVQNGVHSEAKVEATLPTEKKSVVRQPQRPLSKAKLKKMRKKASKL